MEKEKKEMHLVISNAKIFQTKGQDGQLEIQKHTTKLISHTLWK